ncbi:MAG: response regulator [Acidobacteria bacterium]|nr:response regulator [Acidobacteriota bacterium]MBV9476498.1 response regulator [Acidobacteriota bacterium]
MRNVIRYAIAVVTTAAAIALTHGLAAFLAPMRLFFLWAAVLTTAVVAGTGPAIVSIVICCFAAAFLILPPLGSFAVHSMLDAVRLALFASFATGISIAVGARRRAEQRAAAANERLARSELRYRTLVESAPSAQALWRATSDGRIEWSDEWGAIIGQTREEFEAGGRARVLHPDDSARTIALWRAARDTRTAYEDEIRVRVANGRYRWFTIKAVPVFDGAALREWIGVTADIHERKQHEEHAAFINRATEVLSASLDYEETLRSFARLCVPALGDWCAIDIVRDAGPYQRLVVEHTDPARVELAFELDRRFRPAPQVDPVTRALASGRTQFLETITDADLTSIARDAEHLALARGLGLRSSIIAPMIARGRTFGALVLVTGESERHYGEDDVAFVEDLARRAAMALDNARLYEAAEAGSRAKDEFLATLSHELRTPLTAIAGWAHMLHLGLADEQSTRTGIETILRSARQQGELIDDLLDLARVASGTLHLQFAPADLRSIAGEVVTAVRPTAEAKSLALAFDADAPAVLVRGDERRLRQIVWNLVSNAVKFTKSGGSVRVTLTTRDGHARVDVTDSGRGVDPAFLPYVWDRFRQADSSTSREFGGLGLGLSVVRHLVELHGGTVHASSPGIGGGATFGFEVPLLRDGEEEASAPRAKAFGELLRGRRVLVVDDDDDARVVIAKMLEQAGAATTPASSAAAAMEAVRRERFDVIVSDIAMPGEDGYAFVRRVGTVARVPVIAVSAIATGDDDRRRALDAGFAEFLRKPVDPQQLAAAVARCL